MSVLFIRAHERFALRESVMVHWGHDNDSGTTTIDGMMSEVSPEGCRIENHGRILPAEGENVVVEWGENNARTGLVRWASDGAIGVRFVQSFGESEMAAMLEACRSDVSRGALRHLILRPVRKLADLAAA